MTVRLQKPVKRMRYDPLEALVREVDRTLAELGNPSPSKKTGQRGVKLKRSTGVAALDAALLTAGARSVLTDESDGKQWRASGLADLLLYPRPGASSEDLERLSLYEIIFESLASILSPLEFSVCNSTRRLVDVVYRHIAVMEARIPTATVIIRERRPPQRAKFSLTGPTKEIRLDTSP
ncbi:hypothetical protein FOZ61_005986 [Perkinsus olseni]|uniref:Uncharacterized protein n=1 Tax=Perkinsus olseni TaxID=32597 RepID=A0A7J6LG98_PEROL|nr:hypothetical protein FOZ61_005986 [Perkinsus olseni]KAF4665537.1 hypothetical protein FOL46_003594 [Perkinsus olseni]